MTVSDALNPSPQMFPSQNTLSYDSKLALASLREIQNKVSTGDRILIADQLAAQTNIIFPRDTQSGGGGTALDTLRKVGIVHFDPGPGATQCKDVLDYFSNTPCFPAHVPAYCTEAPRLPREIAGSSNYGSYKLDQSMRAPHLLRFALDGRLLNLVEGYIGCTPTLYSINTFWTFPHAGQGLTHDYHRDEDDYRFLVAFIYWTDVSIGEGEFYFIPHTHDRDQMEAIIAKRRSTFFGRRAMRKIRNFDDFRRLNGGNGYRREKVYRRIFKDNALALEGPASTTFVADTFGIHRGSSPGTRPRLVTWIRYGLYANDVYMRDMTQPVRAADLGGFSPATEKERYITRLIVDPS